MDFVAPWQFQQWWPSTVATKHGINCFVYARSVAHRGTIGKSYLYWEFVSIFRIHVVLIKCLIGSYPANKAHSSRFRTYNCWCQRFTPIPSMYGIFIYIWLICLVNAGKYTIDGWYGMHGPSGICDLFSDGELHFVRLVLGHNLPAGNFKLSWLPRPLYHIPVY